MPGMAEEVEVKYRVADFGAVRKALRRQGGKYASTVEQEDAYFDTPEGLLRGRDCGLRIRRTHRLRAAAGERVDTRPLLTAKGPARASRRAKIRREVQTRLPDVEPVLEILRAVGLGETVTVRKKRTTYRLGECLVELDELPDAGRFVEVEAPDEPTLHAVCESLGLTGEPITDHYVNLVLAARGGSTNRGTPFTKGR
jgi:adenylate cyclase class 2